MIRGRAVNKSPFLRRGDVGRSPVFQGAPAAAMNPWRAAAWVGHDGS